MNTDSGKDIIGAATIMSPREQNAARSSVVLNPGAPTHLEQIVQKCLNDLSTLEKHTAANARAIKAVIDALIDAGIVEDFRPEAETESDIPESDRPE
jgi:hypothetical protein